MTDRDQDKDELFEDLDKFFAPIQDVEWPEPEETIPASEPADTSEPADAESEDGSTAQQTGEPSLGDEVFGAQGTVPGGRPERQVDIYEEAAARAEEPFAPDAADEEPVADTGSVVEGIRVRQVGQPAGDRGELGEIDAPEPATPERAVPETAGETEEPLFDSGTVGDWPFPAEAEVEVVDESEVVEIVEPVEAPVAADRPAPDEVDVEAAAEHFASSVRAESDEPVDTGPPAGGYPTEELTSPVEGPIGEEADDVEVYETETVIGEPYDADRPFAPESEVEAALLSDLEEGAADEPVTVGGEGPSWQEPTAVEVGGVEESGRGGPDMPARFLTGVVLAAVALGSLAIGKGVFAVVASVLVLIAQGELYAAMQQRHLQPATIVGLVTGALVLAAAWFHGEPAMLAMLALGTIATFLWYMTVPASQRKHIVVSIGATILPVIYVSGLAGYALITLSIDALDGRALMIAVVALTVIYDTAAFAFGSIWGNRPLAQSISPKKSLEGAVAATLTLVVAAGILSSLVDPLDTLGRSMGLAVVVAIFAPLGDLAESLIKRDLDLKDMSSILPGHGGVLDRIDALLFVAPAAFLYFRIFL